jgi:hypothetical protein
MASRKPKLSVKPRKPKPSVDPEKPKRSAKPEKRKIEHYTHPGKHRTNNPPVGLVTPETDRDAGKKTYAYDPSRSGSPVSASTSRRLVALRD